MDFGNMKYADLQKLAKSHGIKGNQKSNKLIEALNELLKKHNCEEIKYPDKNDKKNVESSLNSQNNVLLDINNHDENINFKTSKNDDSFAILSKNYMSRKRSKISSLKTSTLEMKGSDDNVHTVQNVLEHSSVAAHCVDSNKSEVGKNGNAKSKSKKNKRGTFDSIINVENTKLDNAVDEIKQSSVCENKTEKVLKKSSIKRTLETKIDVDIQDEMTSSMVKDSNTNKGKQLGGNDKVNIDNDIMDDADIKIDGKDKDDNDEPIRKKLRSSYEKEKQADVKPKTHIPGLATRNTNKNGKIDWSKIHKKEFDKMVSIDDYQKKKAERRIQMFGSPTATSTSIKKKTTNKFVGQSNNSGKVTKSSNKMMICTTNTHASTTTSKKNLSKNTGNKNASNELRRTSGRLMSPQVFKPQITSTKRMNLNFSKIISNNKTATTKSIIQAKDDHVASSTNQHNAKLPIGSKNISNQVHEHSSSRKSASQRKSFFSPKPVTNQSTLSTTTTQPPNRSKFDLVASLEKPLSWVPYVGKLKPLDVHKEEPVKYLKTRVVASLRDKSLKEVKTKTMDDKRAEARLIQKEKRFNEQMIRRTTRMMK